MIPVLVFPMVNEALLEGLEGLLDLEPAGQKCMLCCRQGSGHN